MRGKPHGNVLHGFSRGITPADAGKTIPISMLSFVLQDHPRGCGENDDVGICGARPPGSPPRMRGKLLFGGACGIQYGITPADAGKTPFIFVKRFYTQDHPRGCGENGHQLQADRVMLGITPADAGKTARESRYRKRLEDHPRGCGENLRAKGLLLLILGSPPRMRGKH